MSEQRPPLSEHIRQRTQEWLRKAEHELAYLAVAPLSNDDPPTERSQRILLPPHRHLHPYMIGNIAQPTADIGHLLGKAQGRLCLGRQPWRRA